jgi:AcrR family transcriptional regulator
MTTTESPVRTAPQTDTEETHRRVRLPRATREQMMIDVATDVFGANGYHATSMDQIAGAARISKPMLYAYFDSKEGLYSACMRRAGDRLLDNVAASFDENRSAERNLWDGFLAFFDFMGNHGAAWRLVCGRSFYETSAFAEISAGFHANLHSVIEDFFERASRNTVGDPFADARRRTAVAHAMLGAAESLGALWCENHDDLPPQVPCRELMNFFWLGIDDLAAGRVWAERSFGA